MWIEIDRHRLRNLGGHEGTKAMCVYGQGRKHWPRLVIALEKWPENPLCAERGYRLITSYKEGPRAWWEEWVLPQKLLVDAMDLFATVITEEARDEKEV